MASHAGMHSTNMARRKMGGVPSALEARGRRSGSPQSAWVGLIRLGSHPASAGFRAAAALLGT